MACIQLWWLCREVKERMKKTRQDKVAAKASDAKKGGGKAGKANQPRAAARTGKRG